MVRDTRSFRFKLNAHKVSAILLALVFALSIAAHGFGESAGDHFSQQSDIAVSVAVVDMHGSPSDAVCGHVHGEHHQIAPCTMERSGPHRRQSRVIYASFDANAPPHGPPKA